MNNEFVITPIYFEEWIEKTYTITNDKSDYVKIKDVYTDIMKSICKPLSVKEIRKNSFKYLINVIKNSKLSNYYTDKRTTKTAAVRLIGIKRGEVIFECKCGFIKNNL